MLKSYSTTWPYLCANQFYKCFTSYSTGIRFPPLKMLNTDKRQLLPDLFIKSTSPEATTWSLTLTYCYSVTPSGPYLDRTSCVRKHTSSFMTSLKSISLYCSAHSRELYKVCSGPEASRTTSIL